jgi:hypothetical protein
MTWRLHRNQEVSPEEWQLDAFVAKATMSRNQRSGNAVLGPGEPAGQ